MGTERDGEEEEPWGRSTVPEQCLFCLAQMNGNIPRDNNAEVLIIINKIKVTGGSLVSAAALLLEAC